MSETTTKRSAIEIGVTYVNKTWFTLKKKANGNEKHFVIGFYQRGGKAIIKSMPNNNPETIENFVLENVATGCLIYAEENILPESIKGLYELHELTVAGKEIHINNVNNLWRDLKRVIKRTHVQVSQKHLQLYCDEVAWYTNTRHLTPMEKFELLLSNCAVKDGKRTYQDLIK